MGDAGEDAGGCLVACALLISVIWRYAVGAGLVRGDATQEDIRTLSGRLTPSLAGYIAMIALGLFFPILPCSAISCSR